VASVVGLDCTEDEAAASQRRCIRPTSTVGLERGAATSLHPNTAVAMLGTLNSNGRKVEAFPAHPVSYYSQRYTFLSSTIQH